MEEFPLRDSWFEPDGTGGKVPCKLVKLELKETRSQQQSIALGGDDAECKPGEMSLDRRGGLDVILGGQILLRCVLQEVQPVGPARLYDRQLSQPLWWRFGVRLTPESSTCVTRCVGYIHRFSTHAHARVPERSFPRIACGVPRGVQEEAPAVQIRLDYE